MDISYIVRSFWLGSSVPDNDTGDEVITEPDLSSSIQELFERAARGESLDGAYDEFSDDSELINTLEDPDFQDPLLKKSYLMNENERINNYVSESSTRKKKRVATNTKSSSSFNQTQSDNTGSKSPDSSSDKEGK